jgi:transcription termination/antitermination protein NusG
MNELFKEEKNPNEKTINFDSTKGEWYILQVYMGSELAVEKQIWDKAELNKYTKEVSNVLVPVKNVISISPKGKKTILNKAIYPGYVFIQLTELTKSIHASINKIPKVSCFVSADGEPKKLSEIDIMKVINLYNKPVETSYRNVYEYGDKILIKEGQMANFKGRVVVFTPEKNSVDVEIDIFGRATVYKDVNIEIIEKIIE